MYDGTGETNLDLDSPDNTLYLDLKDGRVVIQLRPDLAPIHVQRIKELVRQGFYDGLTFHRVIDGFMAQGGDPDGTGRGGTGLNLPGEFSKEKFKRAAVGMARAASVNSGDSQFFIMLDDARHLDNQYTVWGQVTEGMEFVDNIKKGQPGKMAGAPDTIVRMQIAGDTAN
ncbi:peptidylprolyl isomerase [Pseudomonadota bacterium]